MTRWLSRRAMAKAYSATTVFQLRCGLLPAHCGLQAKGEGIQLHAIVWYKYI